MNAQDLARWTRFAGKGGIGKCTALVDCVAQEMGEDLMFLKVSLPTIGRSMADTVNEFLIGLSLPGVSKFLCKALAFVRCRGF